ncbi:MAG: ATP phosphoribosyltransferase regulatory subunit [Patescibacteria group bacterium]
MQKTIHRIDSIDEIANHYGFKKINIPTIHQSGEIFLHPEQKIPILKKYCASCSAKPHDAVSMLYHNKQILTNKRLQKTNTVPTKNFNFDILGVSDCIAEATIIHTAVTTLKEEGFKNVFVNINSIGDKDSITNFKDALFDYYKSKSNELHPKCRGFYKKDVFNLLLCQHKECQSLRASVPRSIYFLSNNSRKHLTKTIEYLESMNIVYNIDDLLISPNNYFSKIIFEIKRKEQQSQDEILLGRGGRYDELAEKIIKRKNISAVGVSLEFVKIKKPILKKTSQNNPKFYFIQLGLKAKLRSLPVIEQIRNSKISIQQDLHIDKYMEQLKKAEEMKVPYALILGQKEVINDTIIVKDLRQATQKIIGLNVLLDYLKQLA